MNSKSVFFDFDGVIKDSIAVKTEAFYKLYLPFGEEIAKQAKQHHIENGGVSRFEKFKIYHKEFLGEELTTEEIQEWANKFSDLVKQAVVESNYVPGALELIKELSKDTLQFIITGTPQKEIEEILKALNISQYFEEVCGSPTKKIEWSQYLLDKYKLNSEDVIFIGDAMSDYNAANHHGFKFIFREHYENEEQFKEMKIIKVKDLTTVQNIIK